MPLAMPLGIVPSYPWDRVYADTKIVVGGLTDAVFKWVAFQVANDFTDATNIWTEEVPIPVVPDVTSYPFTLAHKGFPNRFMLLYDPAMFASGGEKRWVQGRCGMQVPGTITVGYAPSEAATWNAIIAKIVTEPVDANGYPDIETADQWWIDQYRDALVYGCLARIFGMPAKTFSNPKLARDYQTSYISERSKARGDVIKANTFNGQRWQFPQGWATVTRKGWN
jgi:hypothetical protein